MRDRLLPVALAPALILGIVAMSTTVRGQNLLPEFALPGEVQAPQPSKGQIKPMHWKRPVHGSLAGRSGAELSLQATAGATIPLWSGSAVYQGTTYTFQMVGKDPTKKLVDPFTEIVTLLIPVKITFQPSNVVFDPAQPNSCTPRPAINMIEQSPIFTPVGGSVGGTSLGFGQFTSLFQRGNFFKYTGPSGINPHYQVSLLPVVLGELSIVVNSNLVLPAALWAGCNPLGLIEINSFDSFLQNTILPQLGQFGIGPRTLPVFVFEDVALYDTTPLNCCILGYHNAFISPTSGALQTYVVSMYDTTGGAFGNVQDTVNLSHEVAEWMDDPTTTNPTPPWGNVGQAQGTCQADLEVGDPLSGTVVAIPMPRFTYHVQDLAFKSWFYREAPSIGVNGWYSLFGSFLSYAAPCP